MTQSLSLVALVTQAEQAAVVAGAEQLSESLSAAAGGAPWPIQLNLQGPGSPIEAGAAPTAIVASLLAETLRPDEPIAETTERWRDDLARLKASGSAVFVLNVFRHVPDRVGAGETPPVLERIRRLDLMAIRLSQQLDVGVIDVDRAFAHIGAQVLKTDYRLGGVLAAEVAGHALAWALLSAGLDAAIDPDVQEKALAALGAFAEIDAVVNRRLARRRAQAARANPGP
jgi:hypothetical protein